MDIEIAGLALNASLTLYEATRDDKYKSAAISYGDYILQCQQQDNLSDDVPLKGFFFQDAKRENIALGSIAGVLSLFVIHWMP